MIVHAIAGTLFVEQIAGINRADVGNVSDCGAATVLQKKRFRLQRGPRLA